MEKMVDAAFKGAGKDVGLETWRIEVIQLAIYIILAN